MQVIQDGIQERQASVLAGPRRLKNVNYLIGWIRLENFRLSGFGHALANPVANRAPAVINLYAVDYLSVRNFLRRCRDAMCFEQIYSRTGSRLAGFGHFAFCLLDKNLAIDKPAACGE